VRKAQDLVCVMEFGRCGYMVNMTGMTNPMAVLDLLFNVWV